MPVPGLVVVEQLHPERAHGQIILEFPQFIKGVSVVAGGPGPGRAAEVHTVMLGPDPLLVSFDEHAVGARAPGLDPPISLQRREDTRSLGHARTVEHPADRTGRQRLSQFTCWVRISSREPPACRRADSCADGTAGWRCVPG